MDLQITLHLIELGLFLFSLFWVAMRNTKIINKQPLKTIAIATIFITLLGGVALCIYDVVLGIYELIEFSQSL